ncbi:MAG: hypothetical protein AAB539_00005 [Patescibacteria group bacterium]
MPFSPQKKKLLIISGIVLGVTAVTLRTAQILREERRKVPEPRPAEEKRARPVIPPEAVQPILEETEKRLEELEALTPEEEARRTAERDILTAERVTEDVVIPGVLVRTEGDKRILRNTVENYRMDFPAWLLVARSVASDWIELHDAKTMCAGDPACDPVLRIRVAATNPRGLTLEKWFAAEEKKAGSAIYSPRKKLTFGGVTVWRVTETIPRVFDGYYYYWSRGAKIYDIRVADIDDARLRPSIETFRLE